MVSSVALVKEDRCAVSSELRMAGQSNNKCEHFILKLLPGGITEGRCSTLSDLKQRLAEHNAGKCSHSAKYIPWKIKFYAAFETLELAQRFELYLKSGSGHAFSKRHCLP